MMSPKYIEEGGLGKGELGPGAGQSGLSSELVKHHRGL